MKKYNVWVILMPVGQLDSPFVKGIEYNADWRLVFLDDKQKLYVDITTPRGQEIFNGITDGTTKYPNDSTRNIMIAHNVLLYSKDPEVLAKGLDIATKAFAENPSRVPLQLIQTYIEKSPQLRPQLDEFWKKYMDDFLAHEKEYLNGDNFYHRALGAIFAANTLHATAQRANDVKLMAFYDEKVAALRNIIEGRRDMRW
jgi:hypothetical protein